MLSLAGRTAMDAEGSEEKSDGEEQGWEEEWEETVAGEEERDREMSPVKKPKKGKRKNRDSGERESMDSRKGKTKDPSKVKRAKSSGPLAAVPPDLRGPDTEWWYAFLSKHAELHEGTESGMHLPNPRAFNLPKTHTVSDYCIPHESRSNQQPIFLDLSVYVYSAQIWGWAAMFLLDGRILLI
jgi:hypothetical protein